MTLVERIEQIKKESEAIKACNPEISNIWYDLRDIPVEELSAHPCADENNFRFIKDWGVMQLHVTNLPRHLTIFAYSKKVKITKPEVVEVI